MDSVFNRRGGKALEAEDISPRGSPRRRRRRDGLWNYSKINGIIHELELKYPGFNRKSLKYKDFERICRGEDIVTWQGKIPWEGWYFVRKHFNFIVINHSLSDFGKLFTAFHELGHHFAHAGKNHFHHGRQGWRKKLERQADIIAAIALLPTPLLEFLESLHQLSAEEIPKLFKMPRDFGEFRLKVFKHIHL